MKRLAIIAIFVFPVLTLLVWVVVGYGQPRPPRAKLAPTNSLMLNSTNAPAR